MEQTLVLVSNDYICIINNIFFIYYLVNNTLNTRTTENSNETCAASNITLCQEGSVNSVQNINTKSELVSADPSHCSDHH